MKIKQIISLLVGITFVALNPVTWARGGGDGGGGGFGGGGFHGGGFGGGGFHGGGFGGGGFRGGGVGVGRPAFGAHPAYYYSRGMSFTNSRVGQVRSPVRQAPAVARPAARGNNPEARQVATSGRPMLNGRTDHIAERHQANWHGDWDRRQAHFFNHRFFVFDDGFWFGLDDGIFPWDYYPYYTYDYYPYDYYPGYYADVAPYYYDEGGYSDTPAVDQTVISAQTDLTQLGYYTGPIDGIFGPTTRDAVANYQIAKQLNVTGSLSPDTLQSLGLPPAPAS